MIAGILRHYKSLAVFMDPREAAYDRLRYHSSKLIRIPAVIDGRCSAEMRYLDPTANPYLSFALIIYAGLDGMLNELPLSGSSINDMTLDGSEKFLSYEQLPGNFLEACETSASSDLIEEHIPSDIISIYCGE
jgi:glutamine synthetase